VENFRTQPVNGISRKFQIYRLIFFPWFGYKELPYVGVAPRTNVDVVGRVFTANESPPNQSIPFHHGMAQVRTSTSPSCSAGQPAGPHQIYMIELQLCKKRILLGH
jgi:hypothetical protein